MSVAAGAGAPTRSAFADAEGAMSAPTPVTLNAAAPRSSARRVGDSTLTPTPAAAARLLLLIQNA
jgi:hypothetical protein